MYEFSKIIRRLKLIKYIFINEGQEYYEASIHNIGSYIDFLEYIDGNDYMDERDPDYNEFISVLEDIENLIEISNKILAENKEDLKKILDEVKE